MFYMYSVLESKGRKTTGVDEVLVQWIGEIFDFTPDKGHRQRIC